MFLNLLKYKYGLNPLDLYIDSSPFYWLNYLYDDLDLMLINQFINLNNQLK